MGKKQKNQPAEKLPMMEAGLQQCMRAIDNQIARELQRSPAEREQHGVQKWEPFQERTERLVTFLLNQLGDETVGLDALLVLSQATSKALTLLTEDMGEDGLGKGCSQGVGHRVLREEDRQGRGRAEEDGVAGRARPWS